jgi:hypothetical protein
MVRRGVATTAIVALVAVVLVGATVFGYMLLVPSTQHSSTSQSQASSPSTAALTAAPTSLGDLKISNAALSNDSILVTIQNTGSQAAPIDSLLVTPGSGCLSFGTNTTTTSQAGQNRSGFALPACFSRAAVFLVQSNSTLKPVPLGRFNFTRGFNSTSFSRTFSANSSRTFSGNFSRPFPGNFTRGFPGNFTGIFPSFLGNLSGAAGFQLAAGQAVTLAYDGPVGSGVAAGSQYSITVAGLQGYAEITLTAS